LGEKLDYDVVMKTTSEIIAKAGRKLTKTLVRKLHSVAVDIIVSDNDLKLRQILALAINKNGSSTFFVGRREMTSW
jgi:hypothetical protein